MDVPCKYLNFLYSQEEAEIDFMVELDINDGQVWPNFQLTNFVTRKIFNLWIWNAPRLIRLIIIYDTL
jgi:hypothetical protein